MSVREIMRSLEIVSVVPHSAKAPTIRRLLTSCEVTPELPASMLTRHAKTLLVLDRPSSQLLPNEVLQAQKNSQVKVSNFRSNFHVIYCMNTTKPPRSLSAC